MFEKAVTAPKLPLRHTLLIMAGVYTIQSVIGMFTLQGIPAVLRSEGVSTYSIGLFYVAMLPWALKFAWSPIVERYRKRSNYYSAHGHIILSAQALILLTLLGLYFMSINHSFFTLFCTILLLALCSTFADITTDGLAVDRLTHNNRRYGNIMQVGGSYVARLLVAAYLYTAMGSGGGKAPSCY
ncbi:hypothetical protein [Vibrio sonorensis]|uniref:hypothetical protein n=1 Tax=Vibrio sonorensis TaxID=1004316 RepID=UPI001FE1ED6A|nr:hypothetical protein [Vibrio sonorensis]